MGFLSRRFPLLSPGLLLRRKSITKGILGDSRFWKVVSVAVFGRRLLRKLMGKGAETVAMERLAPGQRIILTGVTARKR